ncbi:MAG: hypothetical protein AAFV88_06320 [Planctomycetota bacterium]
MIDEDESDSTSRIPLWITLIAIAVGLVGYVWHWSAPSIPAHLTFDIAQLVLVSIVIWQACDPFADAAQYLGERWRIPSSVRGATLDAIASSLPELFTGLFFVIIAVQAGTPVSADQGEVTGGDGFGATIATCAGSAVYNMILIPAFCGLTIAATRKERPTIQIDRQVILRDGLSFLICEVVLVVFLFQKQLTWHLAVVLLTLYGGYLLWLGCDAMRYRRARRAVIDRHLGQGPITDDELHDSLAAAGIKPTSNLVRRVRQELVDCEDADPESGGHASSSDDEVESAGILFGWREIVLTGKTAAALLAVSTFVTAIACYWLVEVTLSMAELLQVPVFFVAVIVAAAASSVPDTFLSIGAAKRGDDDGAVSNAFGSNIFDICICLSIPLLAGLWMRGGRPIELQIDGQPMPGLFGLQILLLTLSAITLGVLSHRLELTRNKSLLLVGLYLVFIGYAVIGSLNP